MTTDVVFWGAMSALPFLFLMGALDWWVKRREKQ